MNISKHMKKVILIDISHLFFRAFFAVPANFQMRSGLQSNAIYGVISTTFSLIESEKPTHIYFARDLQGPTLRHGKMDGYKAGRPDMPQELVNQLPYIFGFVEEAIGAPLLSKEGYEADDMIATAAEHFRQQPDTEVLILSGDQDLLQLVGDKICVLQPQTGGKPPKCIRRQEVIDKLGVPPECIADYKALAGDSSDKLVGVPGIGPKGAVQILEKYHSLEAAIAHVDEIAGKLGELLKEHQAQAIATKDMALLHRDLDVAGFDEESGKVPTTMPDQLPAFLEEINSKRLLAWSKRLFTDAVPPEQMGMF